MPSTPSGPTSTTYAFRTDDCAPELARPADAGRAFSLRLQQLDLLQPLHQEAVGGDRFGVEIRVLRIHAARQGLDQEVRVEVQEEGRRIARRAAPLRGRIDHPVA